MVVEDVQATAAPASDGLLLIVCNDSGAIWVGIESPIQGGTLESNEAVVAVVCA